ncbi:CHAD domain-containing protein [Tumidithrix helvetica PCC 7403]|uniref:CHAD domain-containing protein n=1 Tax=Tumidithrix helvetica TaxID=3457545 RepID=UPI003C99FB58
MATNKLSKKSEKELMSPPESLPPKELGEYAYAAIQKQYRYIINQEQGVLEDKDPEYLHQMRVGSRRLIAVLQVFHGVLKLPKAFGDQQVRALAKTLGNLRDLDVQIATVRTDYYDRLSSREQKSLDKVLQAWEKQRDKAFDKVKATLDAPSYQNLKTAGDRWVQNPQYTALVRLPLCMYLPDLIAPLLSAFLMHPGWLIPANFTSDADDIALHDLRKICKCVRYQAELFAEFYDKAFHDWIDEVKLLQDRLGKVQDMYILLKLILKELPQGASLPELQQAIQADRLKALENWEALRQKYLDPNFRYLLYQMILEPLKQQQET